MMINIAELFSSALNYDDRLQYYCVKNCYWIIMEFYKVSHAPLYLNTELKMEVERESSEPFDFSIILNHSPLLPSMTHLEWQWSTYNMDLLFETIDERLKEGVPIVVAVDGYYLPYHPLFRSGHEQHSLIISGVDHTTGSVQIIDYFPPCFFKGEIMTSDLEQAYIQIWSLLQKQGWEKKPESLVLETLQNIYRDLTKRKKQKLILEGIDAWLYLKRQLDMLDSEPVLNNNHYKNLHIQIAKYMNKVNFFQFYIHCAASYINKGTIDQLKNEVDFYKKAWSTFNITVLRNAYSQNANHLFVRQFNDIYIFQQRFIHSIKTTIDKLLSS